MPEIQGVGDLNGKSRLSELNRSTGVTINNGAGPQGTVEIQPNTTPAPQLSAATPEVPLTGFVKETVAPESEPNVLFPPEDQRGARISVVA